MSARSTFDLMGILGVEKIVVRYNQLGGGLSEDMLL